MVHRVMLAALAAAATVSSAYSVAALAQGSKNSVVQTVADLKWTDAGVPGVATSVVRGSLTKGASHFYLRYAGGFSAPLHHHSPNHYVTTVTGNLVLVVDGKEHKLSPGSYFALTNKAKHEARCEGTEACVMFIDARGPWDVVIAKK